MRLVGAAVKNPDIAREAICALQNILRRLLLLRGRRRAPMDSSQSMVEALEHHRDLLKECCNDPWITRAMCAIADAKLCRQVTKMYISDELWSRLMPSPENASSDDDGKYDHDGDDGVGKNAEAAQHLAATLDRDELTFAEKDGKRGKSANRAVLQRRTEKWYRRHLDFLIERSSLNRQMPLPKFGTITADEVLAIHTIFADALASRSSVTWRHLLNSKRWATLPYTPTDIDDKLGEKVTYTEFLRTMLPRASATQVKAMLRYAPMTAPGVRASSSNG